MKLWYNGEKKESGFSPCEKSLNSGLALKNKLTNYLTNKKNISILCSGCMVLLLLQNILSGSFLTYAATTSDNNVYGAVTSVQDYFDKIQDHSEILRETYENPALAPYAGYLAGLDFIRYCMQQPEWSVPAGGDDSAGLAPIVSGYYKLPDDDNIYMGTIYPATANNSVIFQGSSGVSIRLTMDSNNGVNDWIFSTTYTIGSSYNAYSYGITRESNLSGFKAYLYPSSSNYYTQSYNNGSASTKKVNFSARVNFSSSVLPTWGTFNSLYNPCFFSGSNSSTILGHCGSDYFPEITPLDWETIRAMTTQEKDEYFRRYIPDVFNVYYKSVHPELEPYFLEFEPDEETPTDPNPPVNPDGSCCCCNHDIIINNNINNDWVYETQNFPDSPSIDLQIPTADFELLNPSEELETHGNAIALWFDVFNHLIDSFELQGFILMMCGLALAAFIVWRLG